MYTFLAPSSSHRFKPKTKSMDKFKSMKFNFLLGLKFDSVQFKGKPGFSVSHIDEIYGNRFEFEQRDYRQLIKKSVTNL